MPAVYNTLHESLQRTSSDARERLMYCAEVQLRKTVQLFEPLPSQLAYPDLLEGSGAGAGAGSKGGTPVNTAASRLLAKGVAGGGGKAVAAGQQESSGDASAADHTSDSDSRCALCGAVLVMLCHALLYACVTTSLIIRPARTICLLALMCSCPRV